MKNLSIIVLLILALSSTSLNNKAEVSTILNISKTTEVKVDTIKVQDTIELKPVLTQLEELDSLLKEIKENEK